MSPQPKGPLGDGEHPCQPLPLSSVSAVSAPGALHVPNAQLNPSLPATSDISRAIV